MEKKMDNKLMIAIAVVAVILIAGVSFFAGTKFSGKNARGNFADRGNFSGAQQGMQKAGAGRMQGQGAGRLNFIDGELVSKTDQNFTMKLADGGSKIILVSASTTISKASTGSVNDLTPGCKMMINGDTNADGSVTAKTIQLRDANATPVIPMPVR